MPVSADYVARETASNLWRNRMMTVAAVLTVAISLALVGATLLLRQGVARAEIEWQRGSDVTIFMQPTATTTQVAAVTTQLKGLTLVRQPCVFHSQAYDYKEAVALVPVYPTAGVGVKGTPSSFQCVPTQLQDAQAIIHKFHGQPGVLKAVAPLSAIRSTEHVINILQIVFIVVAVVLLVSAAVLILNTIRMAIFARRREVAVMKLVGATNWFIRLPFMSEGLIQGLLGSAVAAGLVYFLRYLLEQLSPASTSVLAQMRLTGWEMLGTEAVVVVVGLVIGTGGSALAIRRFLDV